MSSNRLFRLYSLCFAIVILCMTLLSIVIPITAQEGGFATNTPVGQDDAVANTSSVPMFATNTPEGMTPDDMTDTEVTVLSGPTDFLFNYALRFWLEADFVELVFEQIESLEAGDEDHQLAVNLLLYEMATRFPNAPTDSTQRIRMINAMLNAPVVGALDMRSIVYPFFQNAIDAHAADFIFEAEGFEFAMTPTNLDGTGNIDRLVHVTYEQNGVVLYEEYLLATANTSSSYTLLQPTYDLPAAPHGEVTSVQMEYLSDVNNDTLDELVLRVDDGQVSDRLYIIQHRNGRAVDLVDPARELRVGLLIDWAVTEEMVRAPELVVLEFQSLSEYPDWICNSEIEYTWRFERNLYRRFVDLNENFTPIDSLGCTLRNSDLFSLPPAEAIAEVESALLNYGFDAPSANRALMTLSMLYVLTGRLDDARNTAQSIFTIGDGNSWESQQATALITATNASGNTALDICEALASASEFPACDMNAVLGRLLGALELSTGDDLISQLEATGLPVLESTVVSEIGRADRIAVQFALTDTEWWGFYDGRDGTYHVEPIAAPFGFEETGFPEAQLDVPQSAYDALMVENNPGRVLTAINNILRDNPSDLPLRPSALYLQALAYEFSGDRNSARAIYYAIWETYPASVWGEMASAHLELR